MVMWVNVCMAVEEATIYIFTRLDSSRVSIERVWKKEGKGLL